LFDKCRRDAQALVQEGARQRYPAGAADHRTEHDRVRRPVRVTDAEYSEFYKHVSHDWTDPLEIVHMKAEGNFEYEALLFIPSRAPLDLFRQDGKRGVQLYVKRVFIMDDCEALTPDYLRFIKGVVDAHDLSLNVSREILQKDRQIQVIRKQLVKKVLATLDEMKRDKPEDYLQFWAGFGPALKEGLLAYESQDKDKLLDLVITASTHDANKLTSLDDYVGRMKEGQDAIYFLTGSSKEGLVKSPLLEAFAAKGYEVLLLSDPIDELWLERAPTFKDKPMKSIGRGEVELGTEDERKQAAEALEDKQKEYRDLLGYFRVHLQNEIKEARLSSRLTSSPVCLVADEHDMTPRMQKMMEQLGQPVPKIKPILEINPQHPLIPKLQALYADNQADPRLGLYAELLLGQAYLADSGQLPDPVAFSRALGDVMLHGV